MATDVPGGASAPRLSPAWVISAALLGAVAVTVALIAAARQLPAPDVALHASGDGLVDANGATISAIRASAGAPAFALKAIDVIDEPDVVGTWQELDDFYARQGALWRHLQAPTVELEVGGAWRSVPVRRRGLVELPLAFYLLVGAALVAWLVGAFTYAFSDRSRAARIYAVSAVAFSFAVWPVALYSTRPLALDPGAFRWLSTLDHAGALFFASGVIALLAIYPVRLIRSTAFFWLYAAVTATAGHLQLGPLWLSGFYTANFIHFLLFLAFSGWQWRASRAQPLQRAALGWMLLSMFIGVIFFAALITLPVLLGSRPLISQTTGLVTIVFMFAGISLGVLRFRLFELDRWWFRTWSWLLSGLAVIGVDLVLTRLFDVAQGTALVVALIVAGWVYFPIRQRLFERFSGTAKTPAFDPRHLIGASTTAELRDRFREALRGTFRPVELTESPAELGAPRLAGDGAWLEVPAPACGGSYRCRLRDNGTRLFSRDDVTRAADLVALGQSVRGAITAREEGELTERARIRRDLHDDLGASIIRIAHEAGDEHTAQLAKAAMRDLRDVLTALHDEPTPCLELLEELEAELRARAVVSGRELEWCVEGRPQHLVPARHCANLTRALRETMTNALKHGAGPVRYELEAGDRELRATVSNAAAPRGPVEVGVGLGNIASRMTELGGSARWGVEGGRFSVSLELPWSSSA